MTIETHRDHTSRGLPSDYRDADSTNNEDEIVLSCPNCSKTFLIRDLDYFLENRRIIWRLILSEVENGYRKQKLIGSLAVCSAKQTILSQVDRYGFLSATCLSCMESTFVRFCFSQSTNFFVRDSYQ
ncbi:MAG TPA: hypothetical protein VH415_11655 [Nitrososphaeraceae archaeon]|jgi:hypothetical protein